jgi:hypothetical protein
LELLPPNAQMGSQDPVEAWGSCGATQGDPAEPRGQEKPVRGSCKRPYRKPTQVGDGKNHKVDGRPLVKELGKIVP